MGVLYLILIVVVPFGLLYFFSQYNWCFKKINEQEKKDRKRRDLESWSLLGYLLIIAALVPIWRTNFTDFSILIRIGVIGFGILIIFVSRKTNSSKT